MDKEINAWHADLYEKIGISFEMPNHYTKLTALENLAYFRSLYSGKTYEPMELLKWVGLGEDAHKRVSDYSKGMKIRLNVARSLIHKPKVLFLDEPTSGLDPVNARNIKDLIMGFRDLGTTIFITTHNMMVADELCDRVAFVTDGNIRAVDSPEALKQKYGKRSVKVTYHDKEKESNKEFPIEGLGKNEAFINLLNAKVTIDRLHSQETTLDNIFYPDNRRGVGLMNPMTSTIRKDVKVQVRNKLYAISVGLACIFCNHLFNSSKTRANYNGNTCCYAIACRRNDTCLCRWFNSF